MATYFIGPQGSDTNNGTSEATAWKTLATSSRLRPGDTLTALPGTITGTYAPPSGTAQAPITFNAKEAGTAIIDGSVRVDGLPWQKITNGWQAPFSPTVMGMFQRNFETAGYRANFNSRSFNQYNSNPQLDLHGTPAEFKWQSGQLRCNALASTPQAEPLYASVTEVGLNLNDRSYFVVEGLIVKGHKTAVGTRNGTGIHFKNCRFCYSGYTTVWLVGLAEASMTDCYVQGGGSWEGHYEDLLGCERLGNVRLERVDLSYGGHSGLLILTGAPGKIILKSLYFHQMGGSLLTLKRNIEGLEATDCWFSQAAKSTAVAAHKVPHAGIQLSGKGHRFINCVFKDDGKDALCSSDGNADSNPTCNDMLFDHCTFSGTEAAVVEIQEYAPSGEVARNRWRDCVMGAVVGPQKDATLSMWFSGKGKPTNGSSNVFERCQIGGNIRGSAGSFANVEAAKSALPNVYPGCSSSAIAGAGSSLTEPPSPGGITPPDPPDPPDPPTPGTAPRLAALNPAAGPPGTKVTATGERFGTAPAAVVSVTKKTETPEGKRRIMLGSPSATSGTYAVPADALDGPTFIRDTVTGEGSNELPFDVTATTPANKPPVANAGGPYSGTVGQPVQFDGSKSSDPDGTIASYAWEWGDGMAAGSGAKPVHTYGAAGTKQVKLTVTDNQGARASANVTATITAAPAGELKVTLTAVPGQPKGATYSGAASERPVELTITAKTPDGRTATATASVAGDPPAPSDLPAEIEELIRLHNDLRAGRPLPQAAQSASAEEGDIGEPWIWSSPRETAAAAALAPLVANDALMKAAKDYAIRMEREGFFSHTGPDGSTPFTRMGAAGFRGSMMGENIARGFSTPIAVMRAWEGSSGHLANIMQPGFTRIGAWRAGSVWVVDFGGT